MEKYILKKPLMHNGKEIKTLNLDFDSLTRGDLKRCLREAQITSGKKGVGVPVLNEEYQLRVAAKAAGIPAVVLDDEMSGKDFTQLCLLAQNFLLDGESEEDEEETSSKAEQTRNTPMTPPPQTT